MNRGWLPGVRRMFRLPRSPRRIAGEIDDELRFHLESRIGDLIARGSSPEGARRQAEAEYGDLAASRSELATVDRRIGARERRADLLDIVRQDVTYAVRGLRRQPGFAATIIVTLALAVGANAAVFSLVDPLLFRPPPGVRDPGRVRRLYNNHPNAPWAVNGRSVRMYFSYPEFRAMRSALDGVATLGAYRLWDSTATRRPGNTDTLVANIAYATAELLPMLGVRIVPGRTFTALEDDVDAPADVAVVSRRFARRAFGDGRVLGESIMIRDRPYTVIGVAADGFEGIDPTSVDVWAPFSTQPRFGVDRVPWYTVGDSYIPLVARLNAGIDDRTLTTRATPAYGRAYEGNQKAEMGRAVLVGPIQEDAGPTAVAQEISITTRLAVVSFIVLLIACANVANLLIARAMRRRREIAVRLALGISRARLALQLVIESVILALIAGCASVIVATWAGAALRAALLPRVRWIGEPVGARVLAFTAACAIGAALLAGVAPAIVASRPTLTEALRGGARDGTTHRSRVRATLLVVQSALSVLLLVGSALFASSLRNVRGVDLGFRARDLVVASVYFEDGKAHPERSQLAEIAERLGAMPRISGASLATGAPFHSWRSGASVFLAGKDSAVIRNEALFNGVAPDYFNVARTRILAGRGFLQSDGREAPRVMVASASLAAALWPGENPLGKCAIVEKPSDPCYTVVGVAQDVHAFRIVERPQLNFYLPIDQMPRPSLPSALLVRAAPGAAAAVAPIVGQLLRAAFPTARVTVRSAESRLEPQLRPWRLGSQLFTALSVLALLVAAIGAYGVVSFAMRQRTHEIGVRIALGAQTADVLRLVAARGVGVVAFGAVLGVAAALASGRFIAALLYGVSPRDPTAIVIASFAMLAVGVAASAGPAWAASRVDPVRALRDE